MSSGSGKVTAKAAAECGLMEGTPVTAGALDAACGTLGAGVVHPGETQEQGGQAGGMSICMDTYKADKRLILSYHAVPGQWILQGGTVGGGGVMRWMEKEFADYERIKGAELGKSSLELFNEIAAKVSPGSDGVVFLPYMSGERSPIWDPYAKAYFMDWISVRQKDILSEPLWKVLHYHFGIILMLQSRQEQRQVNCVQWEVLQILFFGHRSRLT